MSLQVLCLGDSLTYGFAMPRAQIWTALCAAQVGADFCNLAVNGNTTGGMLAALPGALAAQAPDAVFLMGGTNDILYGGDLPGAKAVAADMCKVLEHWTVPMLQYDYQA